MKFFIFVTKKKAMKKSLRLAVAVLAVSLCFGSLPSSGKPGMKAWLEYLSVPAGYGYEKSVKTIKEYSFDDFDAVLLIQANGPGTFQRVLKVYPKNRTDKVPAVVVPFYFPEAMVGFELETGEKLPRYEKISMMADLAKRGYASISADSYHLTYTPQNLDRGSFKRWAVAGKKLTDDWPEWTGMGKLVADTRLLIDLLEEDPGIDADRIGIAGHSLGGKMAFYTGCLDKRIKVMLLSDFGFLWEQSNWEQVWYWGKKLDELKSRGMDHIGLLGLSGGKPVMLLAGKYDNEDSEDAMRKSSGYRGKKQERIVVLNHASGHRPPTEALEAGYEFLDRWL